MSKERPPKKLLKLKQVQGIVPLSRSSIYEKMARGEFPRPIKLGTRAVAWRSDEITAWIVARLQGQGGE